MISRTSDIKPRYDYTVCGAGTSGSVVAARPAADPQIQELLLDARPSDSNGWPTMASAISNASRLKAPCAVMSEIARQFPAR